MKPTHLLTLSFDDGFAKSFKLAAEIYEEFGLKAELNIVASGCEPGYQPADEYHNAPVGGWDLWNELAARGHEIGPHSWSHQNHARIPFGEARREVDRCLDAFSRNLTGFEPKQCVYNMPYNASNAEVEGYVETKVRAYRTAGDGMNALPAAGTRRLTCTAFGPGNCEDHLDRCVEHWLAAPSGWLIYNTHGFDEEGWGPIRPDYLRRLLERVLRRGEARVLNYQEAFSAT